MDNAVTVTSVSYIAITFVCAVLAGALGFILGLVEGIERERKNPKARVPSKEDGSAIDCHT